VSKTTVTSGGVLELFGGATASSTTVKSGGTLDVESGYVLSGFAVAKGATVDVLSGGIAGGTVVSSGGMVDAFAGGIASGGRSNWRPRLCVLRRRGEWCDDQRRNDQRRDARACERGDRERHGRFY
jgi:autotransporter passenger strand-loop-strand repeat protein